MTHLESFHAHTVDAKSAYVTISRARSHAADYTDSKDKLANAIELRSGERVAAREPVREHAKATQPHVTKRKQEISITIAIVNGLYPNKPTMLPMPESRKLLTKRQNYVLCLFKRANHIGTLPNCCSHRQEARISEAVNMKSCFSAAFLLVTGCQTVAVPDHGTLGVAYGVSKAVQLSPLSMEKVYRCADGRYFYGYRNGQSFILDFLDGPILRLKASSTPNKYGSGSVTALLDSGEPTSIELTETDIIQPCFLQN